MCIRDSIHELQGKTLVSDCGPEEPCIGDALAAEVYAISAETSEQRAVARNWMRRANRAPNRAGAEATTREATTAAIWNQARRFRMPKPQEAIVAAFRSLYPCRVFEGFQFPMVEDLVNSAPFTTYMEWRESRDLEWSTPLGPALVTQRDMRWARSSLGEQQGAISQKTALPQLVSFQQSPDDHFREAIRVGGNPTPTELMPAVDADLEFAAHIMCSRKSKLKSYRKESLAAIKELKHRWKGVTDKIRRNQHEAVNQVTETRDIGLAALLMVLLHWPDVSYAYHMLVGFPAVGYAPWCQPGTARCLVRSRPRESHWTMSWKEVVRKATNSVRRSSQGTKTSSLPRKAKKTTSEVGAHLLCHTQSW